MANLATISKLVDARVNDARFEFTNDQFIADGLRLFEEDVPNKDSTVVSVSASGESSFAIPSGLEMGYGRDGIFSMEYPLMSGSDKRPSYIYTNPRWSTGEVNTKGFFLFFDGTTTTIRFTSNLTENFRIAFRVPYTVNATTCNVPTATRMFVAIKAATLKARSVAQKYASSKDHNRPEDFINLNTSSRTYMELAKALDLEYKNLIRPYRYKVYPQTIDTRQDYPRVTR